MEYLFALGFILLMAGMVIYTLKKRKLLVEKAKSEFILLNISKGLLAENFEFDNNYTINGILNN